jgi:hypothetical protein
MLSRGGIFFFSTSMRLLPPRDRYVNLVSKDLRSKSEYIALHGEPNRLSILLILLPHYFVNHVESVLVACTAATLPAAPVSMFCIRCAPSTAPGTDSMSSLSFLTSL